MTLAPRRSCDRTAFKHSGTPSHNHERPVRSHMSVTQLSGNEWMSPWPPVWLKIAPGA